MRFLIACLVVVQLLADPASGAERAATPPDSIRVHQGFQIELLRSAQPAEGSWISMTFDDQGRIILAEDSRGLLRLTLDESPAKTTLEPLAGTEDLLHHCRGVLYAHNSLYVCATNGAGFYRLRDVDADGTFEDIQLLCPMDYQSRYGHGSNQITLGPDGMLYVCVGNDISLPNQIDPDSPYRNPRNDWLLPSPHDDGQDDRVGKILKTDPEGKSWTVVAGGLRNQVDVAFNQDGEMFTWDADMEWDAGLPWYRPTRINHIVSGGEYGWRWGTGKWPAWSPDSLPSTLDTGLGSPTGLVFGTQSHWPQKYREALFAADWQNGRILMIDLHPDGASYQGTSQSFLEGSPLNVCDMTFGPDGALYFITGGRGSQSGLYRVTHVGSETAGTNEATDTDDEKTTTEASASARSIRHQLEALQVKQDASELDFIWSQLGSEDVWLRFAARLALENQPLNSWKKRIATAEDSTSRHTALMALARQGTKSDQKIVLKGLREWDWESASPAELVWALRTLQLTLIRQGAIEEPQRSELLRKMKSLPPQDRFPVNWLLMENLTYLKDPEAIERTLELLESAETQEEQIQFAKTLTRINQGWTLSQRERMLDWLSLHRRLPGGKLVDAAVRNLRNDTLESLSNEERDQLTESLARLDEPIADEEFELMPNRPFVQKWKMDDLEADVAALQLQSRSPEQGRSALAAAICLRCHKFGDRGGQVGPDLSAVGKRFDGRAILESILDPSKVIDPKYNNSLYLLDDGRVISGRTLSVGKDQIGVETNPLTGESVTFDRELILESRASETSPMPAGLLDTLSKEEILDLIAYLRSARK